MKIKKYQIEAVFLSLTYPIKKFADARRRDVFLKKLQDSFKEYNEQIQAIYKEFCIKDENGEPKVEDKKYTFENAILEKLNEEIKVLNEEEINIEGDVKDLIENSEAELKVGMTDILQEVLDEKNPD